MAMSAATTTPRLSRAAVGAVMTVSAYMFRLGAVGGILLVAGFGAMTWGLATRWLIATLTSISVIALIYHNAVPRTQPWHSVIPGATLATVLWFSVTIGFRSYLSHFGNFGTIYGSFGVAMALLVWMYLISLAVLVGAEFNAMLFPRSLLGKELTAISSSSKA